MNKKTLLACTLGGIALTFALTATALAESGEGARTFASTTAGFHASTTPPGRGVRDITKDIHDNIGPHATGTIATSTVSRDNSWNREQDARQQSRFIQAARVVWIRINATIIRLKKIITKLDSRITKIKSAGGDTGIAESDSADAKTSLVAAQSDIDSIKSIITSVSSTTPPNTLATTTIKGYAQDAEHQVQTAQSDIEMALKSLSGLKANAHASSTEATN